MAFPNWVNGQNFNSFIDGAFRVVVEFAIADGPYHILPQRQVLHVFWWAIITPCSPFTPDRRHTSLNFLIDADRLEFSPLVNQAGNGNVLAG